jgi:hypothetical protein
VTSPAALFAPPHVRHHQVPEPAGWWPYFDAHRDLAMAPQDYQWTCSIAASTWVLQATGLDPTADRVAVGYDIGYPSCVNEAVGLVNTQCLINLFADYGVVARQQWVDWPTAYARCAETTGVLNSTRWYHFVGIRGTRAGNLHVANSAPGYGGIWDDITPAQFEAWAGSWQIVWLER